MSAEEMAKLKEQTLNYENQKLNEKVKKPRMEAMTATTWRDLIPGINCFIELLWSFFKWI